MTGKIVEKAVIKPALPVSLTQYEHCYACLCSFHVGVVITSPDASTEERECMCVGSMYSKWIHCMELDAIAVMQLCGSVFYACAYIRCVLILNKHKHVCNEIKSRLSIFVCVSTGKPLVIRFFFPAKQTDLKTCHFDGEKIIINLGIAKSRHWNRSFLRFHFYDFIFLFIVLERQLVGRPKSYDGTVITAECQSIWRLDYVVWWQHHHKLARSKTYKTMSHIVLWQSVWRSTGAAGALQ